MPRSATLSKLLGLIVPVLLAVPAGAQEPCGPATDDDPCATPPTAASRQAAPWESFIAVGDRVPEFEAERIDGEARRVDYGGGDTVLLFFLSRCPTCHEMFADWNEAYGSSRGDVEVLGVMLDREPADFFDSHPIDFPVVRAAHHLWSKYGVRKVPLTVRVSSEGIVTAVADHEADAAEIARVFLP